jgi:peptidoglycan hydrolase-like protein with peptidoglycan-binding domain
MAGELRRGDSGEAVKAMQQLLLKWDPDCLPEYGADGDFGKETEDAVKAFQRVKGLPVTGVYDAATEKALMEAVCGWVEITGGSVNVRSAPGTSSRDIGTVHRGDRLPYQGVTQQAGGRDWYLVIYEAQNGWVSGKYAKLVEA